MLLLRLWNHFSDNDLRVSLYADDAVWIFACFLNRGGSYLRVWATVWVKENQAGGAGQEEEHVTLLWCLCLCMSFTHEKWNHKHHQTAQNPVLNEASDGQKQSHTFLFRVDWGGDEWRSSPLWLGALVKLGAEAVTEPEDQLHKTSGFRFSVVWWHFVTS